MDADIRPAEGLATYVLAAIGGASVMLLWLKVGSLLGIRSVDVSEFRWSFVVVAAFGGAVLFLIAQALWGIIGALIFRAGGHKVSSTQLRLVWGAAAFPQVVAVMLLLPLDVLIVGSESFTSTRLSDPVATGWAAISIALGFSLALWSLYVFGRGVEVAAKSGWSIAVAGVMLAAGCAAATVLSVVVALRLVAGA